MPIYEFYCSTCHTIYNFLSQRIDTSKQPKCPGCGRPNLERQISMFSISKGLSENSDDQIPDFDESKMEQAFASMASEADSIDENDPRQVAGLMRKVYDATGLNVNTGMEEAIKRMEAGEDPDKIGEELGDVLEEEDPFSGKGRKNLIHTMRKKFLRPTVDETLYEL